MVSRSGSEPSEGKNDHWGAARELLPFLRRGARVLLSLLAVIFATALCSFITINQPILRVMYDGVVGFVEFVFNLGRFWNDVAGLVVSAYWHSFLVVALALGLGLLFGVPVGFAVGIRPHMLTSKAMRLVSYLGTMAPSFLVALFIMIFFVLYVLPATGIRFILLSSQSEALDPRRLVPIAMTLAVRPLAYFTSAIAAASRDQAGRDYARTARSKGLTVRLVVFRHIWPNVLPVALDGIPVALLFSISALPIVEFVFNWPGVGQQLLYGIVARPRPGVPAAAYVSFLLASIGITYVLVVLAVDSLRARADPRLSGRTRDE
jgi:ABC-type dipeptide/oligopeptide/nickel transport system permease component